MRESHSKILVSKLHQTKVNIPQAKESLLRDGILWLYLAPDNLLV